MDYKIFAKIQSEQSENKITAMTWTVKELQKLRDAGHIPVELFEPSRLEELNYYLKFNGENLREHCYPNYDKFPFVACVPPPNEWHKAPDLQVIDRQTGQVVQVLEMRADYMLCEGIYLQVKAKELSEWEKETADAKNLNKEQHETLKAAFKKIGPNKSLTKNEIITLIEEVRKSSRKKYRQSGHLVDQKLKYKKAENQPTFFDALMPETKQKIEESRFEVKAEGIKLTYAENKLIHALNHLLCEKSQNSDPKAESFYGGNAPSKIVPYGVPDQQAKAPVIKFKPAELYKAFIGANEYSGADIKFIKNTLYSVEAKKFLIKYDRVKKVKEGGKIKNSTDRIEDFQSLIKIISFISDLSDEKKAALDDGDKIIREAKGEIIIVFNPIFRDQIDTKYIDFPVDTQRRLVIAAGGHNKVTASMQTMMEYMLREISNSRYNPPINEENLPYILGLENYVKQKRKRLLKERIDKDIQAVINMGIILRIEKQPNSTGGIKWIFHLNKDYE